MTLNPIPETRALKISLCCITGPEALHVERFLNSFAGAFDELCLVAAFGNQKPDHTLELADAWCRAHGKDFRCLYYHNRGTGEVIVPAPMDDARPDTWPHVDDFGAARQMSWEMATGEWQFWADLDDVLQEGSAEILRQCAVLGTADTFLFKYAIRTSGEEVMRERLFRTGICRWELPVHERCSAYRAREDGKDWHLHAEPAVVFMHQPDTAKPRIPRRNLRIMEHSLRTRDEFPINLTLEWYYEWCRARHDLKNVDPAETALCAEKVRYWGEIANAVYTIPERRLQLYLVHAHLLADHDLTRSVDLSWEAIRLAPYRKEGWGNLAEYSLQAGDFERADIASEIMTVFKVPPTTTIPRAQKYSGWEGLLLRTRCLRANDKEEKARCLDDEIFRKHGGRISLLHATRGRWEKALETKSNFLKSAVIPLAIEHIFAIDADDAESLERLKHHRHVVVPAGGGCVAAWNAAARDSSGAVLVQLSDDWLPCIHWDEYIWQALEAGAKAKSKPGNWPMPDVPLVLAISDGKRQDALLCMAILTRARYMQQLHGVTEAGEAVEDAQIAAPRATSVSPHLFFPGYKGVYSDTEFTVRAYDDGVVIQAQHITFVHQHPLFEGVPWEKMDETYRLQNSPERYLTGKALFNRRNPKHAHP